MPQIIENVVIQTQKAITMICLIPQELLKSVLGF